MQHRTFYGTTDIELRPGGALRLHARNAARERNEARLPRHIDLAEDELQIDSYVVGAPIGRMFGELYPIVPILHLPTIA